MKLRTKGRYVGCYAAKALRFVVLIASSSVQVKVLFVRSTSVDRDHKICCKCVHLSYTNSFYRNN